MTKPKKCQKANDHQVGGDHYKTLRFQPWLVMEDWMPTEARIGYHFGDALSYLGRFYTEGIEGKGGIMEIKKAIHHLQKLVEIHEERALAWLPAGCRENEDA